MPISLQFAILAHMIEKAYRNIITSILVLFASLLFAQTPQADSLKQLIKTSKIDTNKVNYLNNLAVELWGNLDTAIICSSNALETAKKIKLNDNEIGWQKGIGKSYYLLGVFSFDKGNFSDALSYNTKALEIWENLEKTTKEPELSQIKFAKAKSIGEIGNAYFGQSNYPKALEYQFKALKLNEELGREKGIGNILGNIGNIYSDQKNYSKALEYYLKSLKVGRKLGNKYDMSIDLRNIAIVYNNMGNTAKSLEYSMMALVVSKELGNDFETANNLISVGSAIQNQADSAFRSGKPYLELKEQYDKAMDYFSQSIKLQKEQGNDFGLAMNYANIAGIYLVQKKYDEAEKYFTSALAIDSALGSLSQIKHMHEGLSEVYYQKGDFKKSLFHFKLFSSTKDSIFSEEKNKEITRHEMNYEFEKKEAELRAEQDKKEALAEAERKRQSVFLGLIGLIAFSIAIIAIIVFRSLRITRKQKHVIELQKEIVEEKQREVLDSIHYAKRIQKSLLPTDIYIQKNLNKIGFLILFFFLNTTLSLYAQTPKIDSIKIKITNEKDELTKAKYLNSISWEFLMLGNADSTIEFTGRAIAILNRIEKPESQSILSNSFSNLAMAYADKGNFPLALSNFFKSLKIAEALDNKRIISSNYSNIGNVYAQMGELDKSLEFFLKALKIAEAQNDKQAIANACGNIGNLYDYKGDPKKALEYYFKALEYQKTVNDKNEMGATLGNIGLVYNSLGEKEKAITYYFQALSVAENKKDQRGIAIWNGNIGQFYSEMAQKAKKNEKIAFSKKAEVYLLKALEIDTIIGFLHHTANTHKDLSDLYSFLEDYKKSLIHYKLYTIAKDSLYNDEKNKEIMMHELNYEFEKKEAELKAEQDKKEALAEADKKRQNILFWLVTSVAIAISVITIIVLRTLKITKKQKQIIELQKEIVDEKQKEILDSIHYAKRIQQSLLPTEKYISKSLKIDKN